MDLVRAYVAQSCINSKGDFDAGLYAWLSRAEAGEAQAVLLATRGARIMRTYWHAFQRAGVKEHQAAEERKRAASAQRPTG